MDHLPDEQLYPIAASIDHCMTDEAFEKDNTLRTLISMSDDHFIPLEFFRTKPSVAVFDASENQMAEAVAKYATNTLKLDASRTRVCRLKPFNIDPTRTALTPWSIYVEGLRPPYSTEEKITELFEKVDPVHHVVLPESWAGVNKFFGFCFVEFNKPQAVHKAVRLFNRFDLDRESSKPKATIKEGEQEISKLADELDLRVMTKIEWEKLKARYLAHQENVKQQLSILWNEMNGSATPPPKRSTTQQKPDHKVFISDIRGPKPVRTRKPPSRRHRSDSTSNDPATYDKGVVVHVDNVHPKTKKSVLKILFSQAGVTVQFVNFKKDIPSCNVRLATADEATQLVTYFENNPTFQLNSEDAQGARDCDSTQRAEKNVDTPQPLKTRILAGKEEEIYWKHQEVKLERYSQVRQARNAKKVLSDTASTPSVDETDHDSAAKRVQENAVSQQPLKKPKNTHVVFSDDP